MNIEDEPNIPYVGGEPVFEKFKPHKKDKKHKHAHKKIKPRDKRARDKGYYW